MLIRAIALSLALLIGIGVIVPMATEYAEAGPKKSKRYKKTQKKYRKYSKAWWRQYRARQKKRRALQARKRSLRLRQLRLAKMREAADPAKAVASKPAEMQSVSLLPSGQPAPKGWKASKTSAGEIQFQIENAGSASIAVVGPATGETVKVGRNQTVGGVSTSALRREVINRMISENGWVVNDYQKEIGGRTVYVVVAQSQGAGGRVNSRMFYFTEADGRIYSVATTTSVDSAERLAEESEKVVASLASRQRPVQQAAVKE